MIAQASPAAGPLRADPSKRVNYTLGLVLGVDEFQQDQLYHAAGRRGHNRLLHGYGTVWGLRVAADPGNGDPEIQVDPGIAIDPCGREICVADRMCVKLTRWLDRHRPALEALYPDPAAQPFPLAVVLCYRECPTDTVPVPGEPCRTQEDAMAASRIREGFELKLALRDDAPWGSPPAVAPTGLTVFRLSQPEEQAVRAFGLILARVQSTTDELLGADGEARLLAEIYALREAADEGTLASPPAATDDPILLPAGQAPEILRRALRLWVTEVRPAIRALEDPGAGCGEGGGECCVLLAELDLNVTAGWAVGVNQPPPREDLRPYLLHTRLLQEWLIAAGGEEGRPDVDTWATLQILGPSQVRAWVHHDEWVNLQGAVTFVLNEEALAPGSVAVSWAGIRNVWDVVVDRAMSDGDVVELRFDTENIHLVTPPTADEAADWTPESAAPQSPPRTVADELRGPSGEYLDRYGWTLSAFTVYDKLEGGDLAGEYQLPIVARIQTFPVSPDAPQRHDVLHFRDGQWNPDQLDQWSVDLRDAYPATRVTGLQTHPVSADVPRDQFYLVFTQPGDARRGQWEPHPLPPATGDAAGTYPALTVTGLQGSPVAAGIPANGTFLRYNRPGEGRGTWDVVTLAPQGGDVTGTYPVFTVTSLRGTPLNATAPSAGQVLAFEGGAWRPAGAVGLLPPAGGDLEGSYPDPQVVGLRDRPISTEAPADGDVLVFRAASPPGGAWVPEAIAFSADSDLGGAYPDSQVARLQGHTLDAPAPADGQVLRYQESSPPGDGRWVPADPPAGGTTGPAGGDLGGTYPDPQVARLQGRTLQAPNPTDGQILVFRESSPPGNGRWVAAAAPAGGTTGPAGGDLGGTYPNPQVARLQGRPLQVPDPAEGQVLIFRAGRWVSEPAPGGGTTDPAGGDLTGSYPNPAIVALQGNPFELAALTDQHLLRFDGVQKAWTTAFGVGARQAGYEIVAAGQFDYSDFGNPFPESTFNGLSLTFTGMGANNPIYELSFPGFDPEQFSYIVKGTASGAFVALVARERLIIELVGGFGTSSDFRILHLEVSAFPRNREGIRRPTDDLRIDTAAADTAPTVAAGTAASKKAASKKVAKTKTAKTKTTTRKRRPTG